MPPIPSVSRDRLAQPVARRDLEVAQRRRVTADLDHVDHVVRPLERRPALEVRRDRGEALRVARDVARHRLGGREPVGSMSWSAISTPCSAGKDRMSPRRFFVKTTLPAPMNATRATALLRARA